MNNFFTSDWHLGHNTIQKGIRGKFFSSMEEHDATIINNIFETVEPGNNLYFLGDAFWKWDSKQVEKFMTDLKRHRINLHWIIGNHDKLSWTKHSCVKWVGQIKDIIIEKQPITLCHYPMLVYNRSHYNAWQLYGHLHVGDSTHSRLYKVNIMGKKLNMNVELWDYKPVSFEQIEDSMKYKADNWDLIKKEKTDEKND